MLTKRKKQEKWLTQAQFDALPSLEDGVVYHITDAKVDYDTEVSNRPVLKTDNTTAQSTSASETITGTINLHKVAKTGTYTDLLSKPTLGTAAAKDAGTQNGVADLDANGKVPFNELPLDALTGSSAPTTSTAADYVGQWYLDTTNNKTYQCTAKTSDGGTPPTYTYTWEEMARASSISGKVDKSSSNNQVYGTDGSGNQTTYLLTTNAIADAIPKYNADKRLKVDDPSAYNDVANKNYVDTNFSKLDASNLSSANITSWQSACGFERVETVYDMSSNDASINWGFTSGIASETSHVTIGAHDFSPYKKLRVYAYIDGGSSTNLWQIIDLDLTAPPNAGNDSYRNRNVVSMEYSGGAMVFRTMNVSVARTKDTFYWWSSVKFNDQSNNNSASFVYRIEGVK